MKLVFSTALSIALITPLAAEERAEIDAFPICATNEIARFERDLSRARSEHYRGLAHHLDARLVDVCGVNGIILCDRSDAPLPCQHDLAMELESYRWDIIASLPAPEGVGLYDKVHALAAGSSAGDDCAGSTPVMKAWCEAREAVRRVEMAVLAYQLARDEGTVAPAYALGWAEAPKPARPRARKEDSE